MNATRTALLFVFLLLLVVPAAVQAQSSNLVVNGGFETGDFTSWTLSGFNYPASVDDGTTGLFSQISPHSGNYEANFESDGGAGYQYLSQTLPTTAGASYLLSFWFDNAPSNFGEFLLTWNGSTLLETVGVGPVYSAANWTEMRFVVSATGSSTVLQFGFASLNSIIVLDDISVVSAPLGDGYGYMLDADGTSLTITNYTGPGGVVTVPSNLNGHLVTGIGAANSETAVFSASVTSVTLPDGVTSLGSFAFYLCANLTSATLPNSVTNIGVCAFAGCSRLTNLTIGKSVTRIGIGAFQGTAFTNLIIPGSVTNIGDRAFFGSMLASICFAGNAPAVGSNLFEYDGSQATAYYLPGTTGWSAFSAATDVPSVLWKPVIQTSGGNFGVRDIHFGFTITNSTTAYIPIAIQACTNLANPVWTPLQSLTLTNSFYFSDAQWTNWPSRYYGLGFP
jgi:hypothetical protein